MKLWWHLIKEKCESPNIWPLPSLFTNHEFYPTWLTVWPLCRLLFPGLHHLPLRATLCRGWCITSPARPCSSGERSSAPPASCSTPGWRSKPAAASASRRFPRTETGERFCHPRRRTPNPDHTPERVEVWEVGCSANQHKIIRHEGHVITQLSSSDSFLHFNFKLSHVKRLNGSTDVLVVRCKMHATASISCNFPRPWEALHLN